MIGRMGVRVDRLPLAELVKCDEIVTSTPVDDLLALRDRAVKAGYGDWWNRVRRWDRLSIMTSNRVWPTPLAQSIRDRAGYDPRAAIAVRLWDAEAAGAPQWLLDGNGKYVHPWGGEKCAVDMSDWCPQFRGLNFAEWFWRDGTPIFYTGKWREAYSGVQLDDGPYLLIPDWCGSAWRTGGAPLTTRAYREIAWQLFDVNFLGALRTLIATCIPIRYNAHLWPPAAAGHEQDPQMRQFNDALRAISPLRHLEGVGYGSRIGSDWATWLDVLTHLPAGGGHSLQPKVEKGREDQRLLRLTLALAQIFDVAWLPTYNPPPQDEYPTWCPETAIDLGNPLGPAERLPFLWRRKFERAQVFANVHPEAKGGVEPMDGRWIEEK